MKQTIIVKVGTESLTHFHTSEKVANMVRDITRLIQKKIRVILISSGAVGCGREIVGNKVSKQVLASIGQPILMGRYADMFQKHQVITAQVLPTHATLEDITDHREQFVRTVNEVLDM